MPLQQPTKDFLKYLKRNPAIRDQIRAAPGKTLLYAGSRPGRSQGRGRWKSSRR